MRQGIDPVRWWSWDFGTICPGTLPPAESSIWEACYDNDCEHGKRTTRKLDLLPVPIQDVFKALRGPGEIDEWSDRLDYQVHDDPMLHGGGLHVMSPGGWLNCHLDYDVHPYLPQYRRALNIVAFLHDEWDPAWGGQFYLADPFGNPTLLFPPLPGRVVAFEVSDWSYHGVLPISPKAKERVSAAVYYLFDAAHERKCDQRVRIRKRAMFLPTRR